MVSTVADIDNMHVALLAVANLVMDSRPCSQEDYGKFRRFPPSFHAAPPSSNPFFHIPHGGAFTSLAFVTTDVIRL